MVLADTSQAIGAVAELLQQRLSTLTIHNVTIGRPEPPSTSGGGSSLTNPRLNLFLYETAFDGHLRNTPLDEGQQPPLWLVLRFLMTAFDSDGKSDTSGAHRILGDGLRALQEISYLPLNGATPPDPALIDNPEPMKVTLNDASSELLSKLMQGTDEKYRYSMAFEVRPVMIAASATPSYSLLIGLDYTSSPPDEREDGGIGLSVEASLGSRLYQAAPAAFETVEATGPTVSVVGDDLHLSGLSVELGPVELPVLDHSPGELVFRPTRLLLNGVAISAGNHPLSVVRLLPSGRRRRSNFIAAGLVPTMTAVGHGNKVVVDPMTVPPMITADIELEGFLLGNDDDDVFVALYKDGTTVAAFDAVSDPPGPPPPAQTRKIVVIPGPGVPEDVYRVIVRVNGQQARQSPELDLTLASS